MKTVLMLVMLTSSGFIQMIASETLPVVTINNQPVYIHHQSLSEASYLSAMRGAFQDTLAFSPNIGGVESYSWTEMSPDSSLLTIRLEGSSARRWELVQVLESPGDVEVPLISFFPESHELMTVGYQSVLVFFEKGKNQLDRQ